MLIAWPNKVYGHPPPFLFYVLLAPG